MPWQITQPRWLKRTETSCLSVLEATSLKSRCRQKALPAFSSFGGLQASLTCGVFASAKTLVSHKGLQVLKVKTWTCLLKGQPALHPIPYKAP